MSNRFEDPSGVTWHQSHQRIPATFDKPGKWLQAIVHKTSPDGHFAPALTRAGVGPESLSIELDGRRRQVSVEGLGEMRSLRQLHLDDDLIARGHPGAPLTQLRDLRMRYSRGLTEELLHSAPIEFLTLYAPPSDITSLLQPQIHTARFLQGTGTTINTAVLGEQLTELEFQGGGSVNLTGIPTTWPETVAFVSITRVSGLTETSRQKSLNTLYLAGIKGFGPRESIWEIHAKQIVVDYGSRPPKWLIDQWHSRPHDWHRTLALPGHPLLPSS